MICTEISSPAAETPLTVCVGCTTRTVTHKSDDDYHVCALCALDYTHACGHVVLNEDCYDCCTLCNAVVCDDCGYFDDSTVENNFLCKECYNDNCVS